MSNRTYTQALNDGKGAPAFQYIFDPNLVTTGSGRPITGANRLFTTADIANNTINVSGLNLSVGNVSVTGGQIAITNGSITVVNPVLATSGNSTIINTAPIPVSGVFTIPFTNPVYVTGSFSAAGGGFPTSLLTGNSLVGVTGGTLNVAVTGGVLSASSSSIALTGFNPLLPPLPVSGTFTAQAAALQAVSGNTTIINTAPINISGVVSTTVAVSNVAITGFNSTIAPLAVTGSLSVAPAAITPISGNVTVINSIVQPVLNSGGYVGVTGTVNVNVASTILQPVSGNVTIIGTVPQVIINSGGYVGITGAVSAINQGGYVQNSGGYVGITGNVNVINQGGYTAVTGVVAIASANQELALLSGIQTGLLGISGQLSANLSSAAYVTGQVTIPYTSPVYVTGSFSSTVTNTLGVTGTSVDKALPSIGGFGTPFLAVGGRVVSVSGTSAISGYNSTGDMAIMNFAPNGGLLVNQGALDPTQDIVSTIQSGAFQVLNSGITGGAGSRNYGVVLQANSTRLGWGINNLGSGAVMVSLSTAIATTGNLAFILKGASSLFAGDGASFTDIPAVWKGAVSYSGVSNAQVVVNAYQF